LQGAAIWPGWGLAAIPVVIILGWLGRLGVSNLMIIAVSSGILLLLS
jgi:hypothetical protein